ncbi:ATP-binding protein [Aquisalimonas sp.]|uniref:ATP-binding protein n=1 Tax=Aquisalimonas sp. TaxID=1872621 RepID=UPI0025C67B5D|nr:ATP-binding protein [Aquisalimonas sp.]
MGDFSEAEMAAALEACAREPVHRPGAIQPCGVLISLDGELERVLQVSANLDAVLGLRAEQALGADAERLLGSALRERLRRRLSGRERLPSALSVPLPVGGGARVVHVTAYRSGHRVLVELEPAGESDHSGLLSVVNEALRQVGEADSPQRLLETLVDSVRQLTGDERVMVYQFDVDYHGSVVAESRAAEAGSYLGHHFPASDIPRQVRQLYAINPVRSIPDATAAPVPLVPEHDPLEGTPLDLSQGMLRAVSPVHLSYLRNMGVGASLSLAMHGEDGLWGLVACHGLRPRALAPAVRDAGWALVQAATARLMLLLARADARYLRRVRDSRDLLSKDRGGLLDPGALVQRHGPDWLALFRACGVALVYRETVSGVGQLPSEGELQRLASALSQSQPREDIWCSRSLRDSALADALGQSACCGLLAVPLPIDDGKPGWFLMFRPEQIETRLWAGKPDGPTAMGDGRLQLSPRNSFAAWREEIRGCSEPWSAIEQQAAADLGEDLALLVFSREIDLLNAAAELVAASERMFRRLADSLPALIAYLDAQQRYRFVNRVWERWQGASSAAVIGKTAREVMGDAAYQQLAPYLDAAVSGEPQSFEVEFEFPGVGRRYVRADYVPDVAADGSIAGVFVLATDLTEQRRTEEALQRQAEALTEADRRKDEFLAMLGHELRNPLTPIRNATEILNRHGSGVTAEQVAWAARIIGGQAEHLVALTDDLLDVARISQGRIHLRTERVDLREVLDKAADAARPSTQRRAQSLTVDAPAAPVWVEGDPVRLVQIVDNLLGNAVKYTDPGGHITLSAAIDGGQAIVRVRDTGAGIHPELLPHVFGRFAGGAHDPVRRQEGLGLGLYLCKHLTERQGGTIEAHSDGVDQGAEFCVRLPLAATPLAAQPPTQPGEGDTVVAARCRVLIVEDNDSVAESTSMLLESLGHEPRVAVDGPSALDAVESFKPDVVLLDIGLPGMDGYEVARRLRRSHPKGQLLLVALTGYGQDSDQAQAAAAGFDQHLTKPACFAELAQCLRAARLR